MNAYLHVLIATLFPLLVEYLIPIHSFGVEHDWLLLNSQFATIVR